MEVRPQVDDPDVPFPHAEQIARDDRVVVELVELELGDRQHARRPLDRLFGQTVVAFLELVLVVDLDRAEVEAGALERVGDVVEMIGKTEHLGALAEEDDGRRLPRADEDEAKMRSMSALSKRSSFWMRGIKKRCSRRVSSSGREGKPNPSALK